MVYEFNLNVARKNMNISAEKMADDLGIPYSEINQILHKKKKINNNLIGKLYCLYGTDIFLAQSTQNVRERSKMKSEEKEIVIQEVQQSQIKQTMKQSAIREIIRILSDKNFTIAEANDVLLSTQTHLYKQTVRVSP